MARRQRLPILLDKQSPAPPREAVPIQGNGRDICSGRWELIVRATEAAPYAFELCDVANDPSENSDLPAAKAEVTKRLATAP